MRDEIRKRLALVEKKKIWNKTKKSNNRIEGARVPVAADVDENERLLRQRTEDACGLPGCSEAPSSRRRRRTATMELHQTSDTRQKRTAAFESLAHFPETSASNTSSHWCRHVARAHTLGAGVGRRLDPASLSPGHRPR